MTDYERISIRGQFSADVTDAEENLAIRQAQALRVAGSLRQAAAVLEKNSNACPSAEDCEVRLHPSQLLPEQIYKSVLDYAAALDVLTELKRGRQCVYDARQRESLVRGRHGINTI